MSAFYENLLLRGPPVPWIGAVSKFEIELLNTIVHYCASIFSELPSIGARVEMSILEASSWSTNRTWCNPHFLLEQVSVFKATKFLSMQIRERKFPFFLITINFVCDMPANFILQTFYILESFQDSIMMFDHDEQLWWLPKAWLILQIMVIAKHLIEYE